MSGSRLVWSICWVGLRKASSIVYPYISVSLQFFSGSIPLPFALEVSPDILWRLVNLKAVQRLSWEVVNLLTLLPASFEVQIQIWYRLVQDCVTNIISVFFKVCEDLNWVSLKMDAVMEVNNLSIFDRNSPPWCQNLTTRSLSLEFEVNLEMEIVVNWLVFIIWVVRVFIGWNIITLSLTVARC